MAKPIDRHKLEAIFRVFDQITADGRTSKADVRLINEMRRKYPGDSAPRRSRRHAASAGRGGFAELVRAIQR